MGRPTKREYERAISAIKVLKMNIARNREDIDKHLGVILRMRENNKEYEKIIERNNELIMLYNMYEESDKIVKAGVTDE